MQSETNQVKTGKSKGFRVIIEPIDAVGEMADQRLEFEVEDRENVFATVENIKAHTELDAQSATQLAVGLRILGPMMMQQRKHPLFVNFMPHFKDFMLNLKSTVKRGLGK
ncbi:DUF3861 domain-containing protein [Ferrimonas marina]|uniref:DUF3861 domain-containing protein n=1 Tax=Ferrimonas marina TaxID=299255 RepID=A0A1M5Z4D3_9GAMM|nr:DUF3861 domain-containing protein [Ferrimonas marina]SHI19105.1 protein of unknown function [Ferrimonas marina]